MTVQEAKSQIIALKNDLDELNYNTPSRKRMELACMMSVQALEKQIPKKPIIIKNDIANFYNCPNCEMIFYYGQNYCEGCGQALDWEEGGTSD